MPIITADALHTLIKSILSAADVPDEPAEVVAQHLVKANLTGHDSHGLIRIPSYIELIDTGKIIPDAQIDVLNETPTSAVVDGNWGLGFAVTKVATDLVIEKAKSSGMAAATIRRQSHMGRIGWYSERIAASGLIGFVTADSGRAPKKVAPHGGRSPLLGTNPISFAFPSDTEAPVVLDMATSTVANGKINVAVAKGESIPTGWVVNKDGKATTDPEDLGAGGALLPFGGDQAHKGYGLSFVVEVLSGLLTGIGFSHDPDAFTNDGSFVAAFDVSRFRSLDDFKKDMTDFVAYLKGSPLADGFEEILHPGEIEYRTEQQRRIEGIVIDDETWYKTEELCARFGVAMPAGS